MSALALTFERYAIRVVLKAGEPWWVLADVCAVLELSDPSMAAVRLDEDEKGTNIIGTLGGDQEMLIVSEPGLYKLLTTSRKPEAKRFNRWVRHEVLPEIRRTGSYGGAMPTLDAIGDLFDAKIQPVRREIGDLRDSVARVEGNVTFLAGRVDDIVPRREFAKASVDQWRYVLHTRYSGECPCCRRERIVDQHGQYIPGMFNFDHFKGRELNGSEDGWPVCKKCHLRLHGETEYKITSRIRFEAFQADYRDLRPPILPPVKPNRPPEPMQGKLF